MGSDPSAVLSPLRLQLAWRAPEGSAAGPVTSYTVTYVALGGVAEGRTTLPPQQPTEAFILDLVPGMWAQGCKG